MHKYVYLVDLVKSFLTSIFSLLAIIGFDTAENEPLTIWRGFNSFFNSLRRSFETGLFRFTDTGHLLRQGMRFHDHRDDWCSIQYGGHEVAFETGEADVLVTTGAATLLEKGVRRGTSPTVFEFVRVDAIRDSSDAHVGNLTVRIKEVDPHVATLNFHVEVKAFPDVTLDDVRVGFRAHGCGKRYNQVSIVSSHGNGAEPQLLQCRSADVCEQMFRHTPAVERFDIESYSGFPAK